MGLLHFLYSRLVRRVRWGVIPLETPSVLWPNTRFVAVPIPPGTEAANLRARRASHAAESSGLTLEILEGDRIVYLLTFAFPAAPVTKPAIYAPHIARRIAYAWAICYQLDHLTDYLDALDPRLPQRLREAGHLEHPDPILAHQHKLVIHGIYAIELALGTGEKEELLTPYKTILRALRKHFEEHEAEPFPRGLHGWRAFFAGRGWDESPPSWIEHYTDPIMAR